jgi:hypothetical protein
VESIEGELTSGTSGTIVDADLKPGKIYYYRVIAHHANGDSRPSRMQRWVPSIYIRATAVEASNGEAFPADSEAEPLSSWGGLASFENYFTNTNGNPPPYNWVPNGSSSGATRVFFRGVMGDNQTSCPLDFTYPLLFRTEYLTYTDETHQPFSSNYKHLSEPSVSIQSGAQALPHLDVSAPPASGSSYKGITSRGSFTTWVGVDTYSAHASVGELGENFGGYEDVDYFSGFGIPAKSLGSELIYEEGKGRDQVELWLRGLAFRRNQRIDHHRGRF